MSSDAENMTQEGIDEKTQAYFDGELGEAEREEFEKGLAKDPKSQHSIGELQCLRQWIVEGIDVQAKAVPEARFEQIWNQFDKVQSRETRLREAVQGRSWWQRVWTPIKLPRWVLWSAAAGGTVALAILMVDLQRGLPEGANLVAQAPEDPKQEQSLVQIGENSDSAKLRARRVSEDRQRNAQKPSNSIEWQSAVSKLAANESTPSDTVVSVETSEEAKIEQIEFGGSVGHISRIESARGTTTVIWITEDDTVVDGEIEL